MDIEKGEGEIEEDEVRTMDIAKGEREIDEYKGRRTMDRKG